ncbi:MAG: TlpA family protein disulfide reductase [Bacteroidetes bacterium]|nr:TlpA family protein disulfide reductase [Bacteroidota bacterium]
MKPKILSMLMLLLIVLLIIVTEYAGSGRGESDPNGLIGILLPSLTVSSLSGQEIILTGPDRKNQLLIFFSTECEFCLEELLFWNEHKTAADSVLGVLCISVDPAEVTAKFLSDHSLDLPVYCADRTDVRQQFRITRVPSLFVADTEGIIKGYVAGAVDKQMLSRMLSELLHEQIVLLNDE